MLLPPEKTLFVRGATPLLLLSGAPVHDALPPLTAPAERAPRCEGWTLVPRLTVCVVDGPGDLGVLVPALTAPVLHEGGEGGMAGWCADAERAGGAVVACVDALPETLDRDRPPGGGTARGGFVPLLA
ncbi:hypothetical protein GCM10027168_15980 [Streptomyces capparidis]